VQALEPYAEKYSSGIKFSFFTKAPGTEKLCDMYGILSNDELLLLENPRERHVSTHSHVPSAPKYRLETVTPSRAARFFEDYAAGSLQRYLKSSTPRLPPSVAPAVQQGLRELSGWDFIDTVKDPNVSVLVEFVSSGCDACKEFASAFEEVATQVAQARRRGEGLLASTVVARIDQSLHEHTERIMGTPWLRYWPRGLQKHAVDVQLRSVSSILDFLEVRAIEETGSETESSAPTCKRNGGKCPKWR